MTLRDRFDEFADRAADFAEKATDRARDYAAENNTRINEKLERAAGYLDQKTGGKYSERIQTGMGRAKEGLDRFSEPRQDGDNRASEDGPEPN